MADLARAGYRVRQVVLGFRPALTAGEITGVRALLNEAERERFMAMDARDRRHSVDMVRWLREHAVRSNDVLVAALLHDVGKGHVGLAERVAFVILGAVVPGLRERIGTAGAGGFSGALWRLEHHAAIGAAALEQCSSIRVRWLTAHHTDRSPEQDEELQWLIAADSAC